MPNEYSQFVRGTAQKAVIKFLAERGEQEEPSPLRKSLVELVASAYEAGRRRAYQSIRITTEVSRDSLNEVIAIARREEGDEHEAATGMDHIWE